MIVQLFTIIMLLSPFATIAAYIILNKKIKRLSKELESAERIMRFKMSFLKEIKTNRVNEVVSTNTKSIMQDEVPQKESNNNEG